MKLVFSIILLVIVLIYLVIQVSSLIKDIKAKKKLKQIDVDESIKEDSEDDRGTNIKSDC